GVRIVDRDRGRDLLTADEDPRVAVLISPGLNGGLQRRGAALPAEVVLDDELDRARTVRQLDGDRRGRLLKRLAVHGPAVKADRGFGDAGQAGRAVEHDRLAGLAVRVGDITGIRDRRTGRVAQLNDSDRSLLVDGHADRDGDLLGRGLVRIADDVRKAVGRGPGVRRV